MTEEGCEYKHPEGYCELERGDCEYQGGLMECLAVEDDLIAYCPDCDEPEAKCTCWKYEKEAVKE